MRWQQQLQCIFVRTLRSRLRFRSIGVIEMKKLLKSLRRDELGAAAAEYALILAVVGGGIAVAALALGVSISGAMGRATTIISGVAS